MKAIQAALDKAKAPEAIQNDLFERFMRLDRKSEAWIDEAQAILVDRDAIINLGAFMSRVLTDADVEAQNNV